MARAPVQEEEESLRDVFPPTLEVGELERRQVWLAFASASVSGFANDRKLKDDDIVEVSTVVADELLEEYLARFDPSWEEDETEEEEEEEEEEPGPPARRRRGR